MLNNTANKRLIKLICLNIVFILGTINFVQSAHEIRSNSKRFDDLQTEISTLEKEKQALEIDLKNKQSDDYVERIARNELNMIKPGEKVYFIKKEPSTPPIINPEPEATVTELKVTESKNNNFALWWQLFFDKNN